MTAYESINKIVKEAFDNKCAMDVRIHNKDGLFQGGFCVYPDTREATITSAFNHSLNIMLSNDANPLWLANAIHGAVYNFSKEFFKGLEDWRNTAK